jgi:hypothetical protein
MPHYHRWAEQCASSRFENAAGGAFPAGSAAIPPGMLPAHLGHREDVEVGCLADYDTALGVDGGVA